MPRLVKHRFDELPLDRRIASEARGINNGAAFGALYERREIEPNSPHVKRRTGTKRVTNTVPNLLGLTYNGTKGRIVVDHDFTTPSNAATGWTIFGTVDFPVEANTDTKYFRVLNFANTLLYAKREYVGSTNVVSFQVYDADGVLKVTSAAYALSSGSTLHFMLCSDRTTTSKLRLNAWALDGTVPETDLEAAHTIAAAAELRLLGEDTASLGTALKECVLNNVRLFNNDNYVPAAYNAIARGSTADESTIWQAELSEGGDLLQYSTYDSYLIPSTPSLSGGTLRMGGLGAIEIPFYLDFDEYFWTTTNAAARLSWCFQLKVKLPQILTASTLFELQDLVRLQIVSDSGFKLRATFNDTGSIVTNSVVITAGASLDIFVARDSNNTFVKVGATEVSGASSNPIVYAYDKTIGFIVGDRVDFEHSDPFGGQLELFALHNTAERAFHSREDAVLYYDAESIQGDEVLDRGNRALNGYLGVRSDTQAPFYKEGGFPGGAYVAATGGYLVSNAKPDIGYDGQLRKPLTKDVVIQRRGRRAFLTSNGVNYVVDDRTKNIRPLGLPRPSTKVSCTPQGVGAIDGFVRYAYRYVSIDGTVGPVFELDPCDATGGVNVFLGAEAFGTPNDPTFGLAYGEVEKDKLVANDAVECFIARDVDTLELGASPAPLLHREKTDGLTLEVAFRLPTLAPVLDDAINAMGVYAPEGGTDTWCADNEPVTFPWLTAVGAEACMQFTFRWKDGASYNTLFCIGNTDQKYETGGGLGFGAQTHWRVQDLYVSLQPPENIANEASLVVCRDKAFTNGNHRDGALFAMGRDVKLIDGHDYTVFVQRGGTIYNEAAGTALAFAIYDHTADTWANWYVSGGNTIATTTNEVVITDFWTTTYSGGGGYHMVMWGMGRREGNEITGKTLKRNAGDPLIEGFDQIPAFYNGTLGTTPGQVMYHGRMWRRAIRLSLLAHKGLTRYGARSGPLSVGLEVDVAFASDSAVETLDGGFDYPNDLRVKFYNTSNQPIAAFTLSTGVESKTVFLAYGHDAKVTPGTPDTHEVTSTDDIPLWVSYSSRESGTLTVGTGKTSALTISEKKWHDGATQRVFADFANTIDLKQWTWVTLFLSHETGLGAASSSFEVVLQRVFLDGNTGDWGDLFNSGVQLYKADNAAAGQGVGQYALFTVGGVTGIDSAYEVEIAEVRLWDGERYVAAGGGHGIHAFGPYLSSRVPPNYWGSMHHYLRFAPIDVDDMASQTLMDQHGGAPNAGGVTQVSTNAVKIYQNAEVKEGEGNVSGGASYYIPFPTPPLSAIRGIQIFRSQVTPVQAEFANGSFNPNAQTDAFRACRAAPLYYLSEIPDGTQAYYDTAIDTLLGAELNLTEGLIPGNPGGIFEWNNYLGIWVTDAPRIHFAAAPDSWESFPSDMVLELPLKEAGTIQAATELASRDARNSRVLVLGKSWGVFLDGSPAQPRVNTLGGGVGASSSRCLVVEKGIAYAYNGTLWAITGDGAVEDIGMAVLDLLPPTDKTRLSVSSSLGSLFVINEETGLTLRWHFARREWFVEDRYALGTTDIAGVDNWVNLSGYPSAGDSTIYADDVETDSPLSLAVITWDNAGDYVTVSATTGIKVGQRITVACNEDARIRYTLHVSSFTSTRITFSGDLDLPTTSTNNLNGTSVTLTYTLYPGIGYWGTMLDTGQFINTGMLQHVDIGITSGDGWQATTAGADFARDPSDLSVFDAPESFPTAVLGHGAGAGGASARWGLTQRQKVQRLLIWTYEPEAVGLSELELNYTPDD